MLNKDALRKAIEKANFKSVRGSFRFGPNQVPIQNPYLQEVVLERGRGKSCRCPPCPPFTGTAATNDDGPSAS